MLSSLVENHTELCFQVYEVLVNNYRATLCQGLKLLYRPTDQPCNECESCQDKRGSSWGRPWDRWCIQYRCWWHKTAARDTNYSPQRSKFKVYIIDEVHMSPGAQCFAENIRRVAVTCCICFRNNRYICLIQSKVGVRFIIKVRTVPTIVDRIKVILNLESIFTKRRRFTLSLERVTAQCVTH